MTIVLSIFLGLLSLFTWIIWAILILAVFLGAVAIPFAIWELFMYFTFNNVINLFAKIPFIGPLLAFLIAIPFAIISTTISLWALLQAWLMGILTFCGDATSTFCKNFIQGCVVPWEDHWSHSFVIIRFYYDHMQWLWGGANFMKSWFFWQNGCWCDVGNLLPIPFAIIKVFLLALPYTLMFVLPILPVLWSFLRPIVGACSRLPAVSGNGDGRN